MFKIVSRD